MSKTLEIKGRIDSNNIEEIENNLLKEVQDYGGEKYYSFIFEDEGIPFNPLEKETPNTSLSVQDRKIGGLGIYITKTIVDDMKYTYNNKNILTLIVDITKERD